LGCLINKHSTIYSLIQLFHQRCAENRHSPFIHYSVDGQWQASTWGEVEGQANSLASLLATKGVKKGTRVLIIAENSKDWIVTELAVLSLGASLVTAYTSSSPKEWEHILRDSGSSVLIADNPFLDKLNPVLEILNGQINFSLGIGSNEWKYLMENPSLPLPKESSTDDLDETVCIIYTSGTGGPARGVELSNRNILNNCLGAANIIKPYGLESHRFLSILPFAHAYAHSADIWTPIYVNAQIFISNDIKYLNQQLQYVKPTIMNTIPRLWDVLKKQISASIAGKGFISQKLFSLTLQLGRKKMLGLRLGPMHQVLDSLCNRLVRNKIKEKLGGYLVGAVVAGSPLSENTASFFGALGINLHQAYGQTECGPGITMLEAGNIIPGTVGGPLKGMEIRLAEDGEILVRGPNVMKGYWNAPDLTAKAIQDGWLHTGDIGKWSEGGLLQVLDRKKDFIKTSGSEMISPQYIEQKINAHPDIEHAIVFGHGKPFLVAAIFPSPEYLLGTENKSKVLDSLSDQIERHIKQMNISLDAKSRVKKFLIIDEALTIADGTLTPSLKVKRDYVYQTYTHKIEKLFNEDA
jgi:long-chain acyl-CoA synthetase